MRNSRHSKNSVHHRLLTWSLRHRSPLSTAPDARASAQTKTPAPLRLLGEARLYQDHHRIGLGDRILGAIVMHRLIGNVLGVFRTNPQPQPPPVRSSSLSRA